MKKVLYILILTALSMSCTCQKITLLDYNQADSSTNCTHGLISGSDEVVFKALVDYSQDTTMKYVIFQKKRQNAHQFTFLTDCNIQEECNSTSNTFCKRLDTYEIEISIKAIASSDDSGAKIRGVLHTSKQGTVTSSVKTFPQISDYTTAVGTLIINGITINHTSNECHHVITKPELNVVFICRSKALPCLIEISTDNSSETERGEDHVTFNRILMEQQQTKLNIKYSLCKLGVNYNFISCNLTRDDKIKNKPIDIAATEHTQDQIIIVLIVVISSILASILITMCLLIFRRYLKRMKRERIFYVASIGTDQQRLLKDFNDCNNSESHNKFVPINKLNNKCLPKIYHGTVLLDLINNISNLTVKICITYVSLHRPQMYPERNVEYPLYDKRGAYDITRNGTGFIKFVRKFNDNQKCPCYSCQFSPTASNAWGTIHICTSKSLVFDDSEAFKSIFKICFNEDEETYCLDSLRVISSDIVDDLCIIECATCNNSLLNTLEKNTNKCMQQMNGINNVYNDFIHKDRLTIMVSHPHGWNKHVSIGNWTMKRTVNRVNSINHTKYFFTAPSCLGCVGAFVFIIGASNINLKPHVLSGIDDKGLVVSSTGSE